MRATTWVLAYALFAVSANSTAAQTWEYSNAADAAMVAYQAKNKVPNVSVAIAKNGRILYSKGWQWTDSARPVEGGDQWVFRLASVSKPITSIMAMELVQNGRLDLDKPIRDYLPELPAEHRYTPRDLLTHLSGVRHYRPGTPDPTGSADKHYRTASSALKLFAFDPLLSAPREKFSYSTHGYTILAAAIERVTGRPFAEYARSKFRAWDLTSLRPESPESSRGRIEIYDRENSKTDRDDLSWKYAGGGLESTARDLCKLTDSLLNGFILTSASRSRMWTPAALRSGSVIDYGLGWRIGSEAGRRLVSHSGGQRGANSFWKVYPDHGIAVVVLTNREATQPAKLADYLSNLAFITGTASPAVF